MKRLSICVPQYKETDEVIAPLLNSLVVQQNIDFDELEVVIVNDGSDVKLTEEFLKKYPFEIKYLEKEHEGVSAARQYACDHSTGEYVMFCDADDMFFNACGLWMIFREMDIDGGFDTLTSAFIEESRIPTPTGEKEVGYLNRNMDSTFVHGKVHRRKYLINNNIKWNPELTIHEDSYFNCLCQSLVTDERRGRYCQAPFYLWRWRDESVCRHDPLYLNKTMVNMLESNTALVKQFLDRGREDKAKFYAANMIYDTYYSLNCDRWWTEEGKEYLPMTEKRFKKYWDEFKWLHDKLTKDEKLMILSGLRNRFFQEGLVLERITFDDWIKHIESIED